MLRSVINMKERKTKKLNSIDILKELLNLDALRATGYFECPASLNHHSNHPCGLLLHSELVAKTLVEFTDKMNLSWERESSPVIIGYLHDLCKTDDYIYNRQHHQWERNPKPLFKGHGGKSVILASQLIELTWEEIFCITYHMGAFTDKSDWNYYREAAHKYPNVLWTHHADILTSYIIEREGLNENEHEN